MKTSWEVSFHPAHSQAEDNAIAVILEPENTSEILVMPMKCNFTLKFLFFPLKDAPSSR